SHEQRAEIGAPAGFPPHLAERGVQRERGLLALAEPVHRLPRLGGIEAEAMHQRARRADLLLGHPPVALREESHREEQQAHQRARQRMQSIRRRVRGMARVPAVELVAEHQPQQREPGPRGEARDGTDHLAPVRHPEPFLPSAQTAGPAGRPVRMLTARPAYSYGPAPCLAARRAKRHHAPPFTPATVMDTPEPMFESRIPSLPLLGRGKVRDIYAVDDRHILIVTTDRLSAYDVVLPDPVPGKGQVLNEISLFWFRRLGDIVPNHLVDRPLESVVPDPEVRRALVGRSVIARRLTPLPIEAVVRGYLAG